MKLSVNKLQLPSLPSHRFNKHSEPKDCEICTWEKQMGQLAATCWPGALQVATSPNSTFRPANTVGTSHDEMMAHMIAQASTWHIS